MSEPVELTVSVGDRQPSSFRLIASTPDSAASVGNRSIAAPICETLRPGGIRPGQRISSGERTPPSSVEPLRPFMPPFQRKPLGPLSQK